MFATLSTPKPPFALKKRKAISWPLFFLWVSWILPAQVLQTYTQEAGAIPEPLRISELQAQAQRCSIQVKEGEYTEVSGFLNNLKRKRVQSTGGYSAYDLMVQFLAERLGEDVLHAWIEFDPENSIAYSVMGQWEIDEAWRRRGSGWATTVRENGWRGFSDYLVRARRNLEKAVELDPGEYVACANMIPVCMGQSDKAGCRIWFDRAVAIDPEYFTPYSKLAWALYPRWLGSEMEVQAFLVTLLDRDPKFNRIVTGWMENERSTEYRDPDSPIGIEARRLLQAHVDAYPRSGSARRYLGKLLWLHDDQSGALIEFEKSAQLDPDYLNLYEYANALYRTKHYNKAEKVTQKVIEAKPDDYHGYALAGRIQQFRSRNYMEAIHFYTEALNRKPSLHGTVKLRGDCYFKVGEYEKAVADFNRAIEYKPEYDRAYFSLGKMYFAMGNIDGASEAFEHAIRIEPSWKPQVEEILGETEE